MLYQEYIIEFYYLLLVIYSHISRILHAVIVQTQGQSLKLSVNYKDIHEVKSKWKTSTSLTANSNGIYK